ncbi:MAG: alpha/beta hydrolase [Planctomycetota bacterium]
MTRRRKLLLSTVALALLALGLGYALGPRRRVDTRLSAPALPEDLERYVREREAAYPDIVPGCAATIARVASGRTPLAVVYLHGFSATRQETAPLTERVATALGANRFEARLAGHGRGGAALGAATVEAWLRDGAEALAIGCRLGRRVVVIACSTGGSLATWLLANGHAQDVAALVLISPNFGPRHPASSLLAGPWGLQLAHLLVGEERSWEPWNEPQGRFWTTRYPTRVLVEMQALVELAKAADLSTFGTPLLMIHSPDDQVLDPRPMVLRFHDAASAPKQRLEFRGDGDPSHHVLAGDVLSPGSTDELAGKIVEFVRALEATP